LGSGGDWYRIGLHFSPANDMTRADACYYCHGTRLKLTGTETRDTDVGELEFPVIAGWPNQGVGRINLDGSRGACSACHTRHRFSIEDGPQTLYLQGVPCGTGRAGLQGLLASKHGTISSSSTLPV
jgi:hydroxylamine dehydrogenase